MILSADSQARMAVAASVLAIDARFMARVETEIAAIFAAHPSLARTEAVRMVLWGLAFKEISLAASDALAAAKPNQNQQAA